MNQSIPSLTLIECNFRERPPCVDTVVLLGALTLFSMSSNERLAANYARHLRAGNESWTC